MKRAVITVVAVFVIIFALPVSAQDGSIKLTPEQKASLMVQPSYPSVSINTNQEARAELLRIQMAAGAILVTVRRDGRTTLNDLLSGPCSPDALYAALVLAQKDFIPSRPEIYPPTGETGIDDQRRAETAALVRRVIRDCAPSR